MNNGLKLQDSNFRVDNADIYIQKFNWVSNWINEYFFNKVSDFLLGLLIFVINCFWFFCFKNKKTNLI